MAKQYGLAINNDVIARMAEIAALETEGVSAMGLRPVSLPEILGKRGATKSVSVSTENGIIDIDLYIKVNDSVKVGEVAEHVQASVKEKLQGMTGSAVTRVNVVITDVALSEEQAPEQNA